MMFENLEELLKDSDCRVVSGTGERWLYWDNETQVWGVSERVRYAKKTKPLYQGNDLREAMQFLKKGGEG